jgi:Flp pilus assembly pilin Flp
MFKTFLKNKKAQNTAEYALLIALVVAGVIAMQTYAQRALQARVRDASQFLAEETGVEGLGNTVQYEPYYLKSNYEVTRDSSEKELQDTRAIGGVSYDGESNRTRGAQGFQQSVYNGFGLVNGL